MGSWRVRFGPMSVPNPAKSRHKRGTRGVPVPGNLGTGGARPGIMGPRAGRDPLGAAA